MNPTSSPPVNPIPVAADVSRLKPVGVQQTCPGADATRRALRRVWLGGILALTLAGCGTTDEWRADSPPRTRLAVTVARTNYLGWPDAIVMRGGGTEAWIVPAIGRIAQFQFTGEPGPFWLNQALLGQEHPPHATNWINFGGDKTWPAPEGEWPKPHGGWLPPAAFDALPVEATIEHKQVTLTSPVDPAYGIRTVRRIQLGPAAGSMTVWTRYEKVSGPPQKVGVWIITQLREPVLLAAPVRSDRGARFTNGFHVLSGQPPPSLQTPPTLAPNQQLVTLTRDPRAAHKIGLEGDTLIWVGDRSLLAIQQPVVADGEYPDHGSSAEIYTNPDPLQYIELEMLSPLRELKPGDSLEWHQSYTLHRRRHTDPVQDIQRVLNPSEAPPPPRQPETVPQR